MRTLGWKLTGWGPRGDSGPARGRVRATQPASLISSSAASPHFTLCLQRSLNGSPIAPFHFGTFHIPLATRPLLDFAAEQVGKRGDV